MRIEEMFRDDINRKINGVVMVDQNIEDVLVQELDEYVITMELKKHFITFFNNYGKSLHANTADIGVWISGFFGSGKSHFLKILSYLLENKEVQDIRTVERFRKKFEDDPATFMLIDSAMKGKTDTILFNIAIEGSINKDKTAVLRVFAKMFYNYLGFYGENLKVAKLEQFIDKRGKTADFHRVFEEKHGQPWLDSRDAFAFFEDDVVATLQEVLGMSKGAATNWFNGSETVETSIAQLVLEIKEYVSAQSGDFRLLFMIDEVGQYVGGDTDLLINLQSLVEKIGSECNGKVWVICTGQEAIDDIIKARENEFSRIQARFKTRLSLSSYSVDEVIQKRILNKTPDAAAKLENIYNQNDSVICNLFSFSEAIHDIKGYSSATEFSINFPFIPYQFTIMQKVFAEIRKHGNSGKHLSGGERSMLSGFQEVAQKIKDMDEFALAPFYMFYDTVHTFLDGSIRRVIERCARAAKDGNGIEPQDVNVLKLLYLIRYVKDIPANIDNIIILMANDIRIDTIIMRESVRESLNRLQRENYIGRVGDIYNFLTDEEQDVTREIKNTPVDTSAIVERIAHMVYGDIYTTKKYRYGIYDFAFDQMVDNTTVGATVSGMKLRLLTVATDSTEKTDLRLMKESSGQAIVVLADTPYYEALENAMKIRKYVKQRNVAQLARSVQNIIRDQQDEAGKYEASAGENLKKAIVDADFYVDGEHIQIKSGDAKSKLDQVLEYLVSHVYSELGLITKNAGSDADIISILTGKENHTTEMEPNHDAVSKVEEYLEMQYRKNLPTSMADVQSRYQAIPYGWREIDIASVVARLIYGQKVTVKYGGATIQPDNARLPDMLRKKSEIGKTNISKRQVVSVAKMKEIREFLREYFDIMDVPKDEDGLIKFIVDKFTEQQEHYETILKRYEDNNYPDKGLLTHIITLIKHILSQTKDNIALINYILKTQDNLYDSKDSLHRVESFFKTQVTLFDAAVKFEKDLRNDMDYISKDIEANNALNRIRLITMIPTSDKFDYRRIPELNGLMQTVKTSHNTMLEEKRTELLEIVRQCMQEIHTLASNNLQLGSLSDKADEFYDQKKKQIRDMNCLALMDGLVPPMWRYKDETVSKMESLIMPKKQNRDYLIIDDIGVECRKKPEPKKEIIKSIPRQAMFPARTLRTEDEIDKYIEEVRSNMKKILQGCDGIKVN